MKSIEEMAHDYMLAEINKNGIGEVLINGTVQAAYDLAESMQVESEKRKPKEKCKHEPRSGNVNEYSFFICRYCLKEIDAKTMEVRGLG